MGGGRCRCLMEGMVWVLFWIVAVLCWIGVGAFGLFVWGSAGVAAPVCGVFVYGLVGSASELRRFFLSFSSTSSSTGVQLACQPSSTLTSFLHVSEY